MRRLIFSVKFPRMVRRFKFLREISPYGVTGAKFDRNSTGLHTDLKMGQIPGIFEILRPILGAYNGARGY